MVEVLDFLGVLAIPRNSRITTCLGRDALSKERREGHKGLSVPLLYAVRIEDRSYSDRCWARDQPLSIALECADDSSEGR